MLSNTNIPSPSSDNGGPSKRKRRPAGTPDPDAEVVSLSPKTLLESDRYVCEICGQGFQRDQNLQMHRRRHKVPWKLLKRETAVARKRVYVCPEPSCLHHDPRHALGDLVGIKKHFRRKHSNQRQWVCAKCSKGYAVQSDYKAHLKTCGTRGHSCDCGRVFSRVESFIEHQDACSMGRFQSNIQAPPSACLSRTASSPSPSPSPSSDTNLSVGLWPGPNKNPPPISQPPPNLELELLTRPTSSAPDIPPGGTPFLDQARLQAEKRMRVAMTERAQAEEARARAKRQLDLAEQEFSNAKRIRQQAQAELKKAQALRDHAADRMNSTIWEITCHLCRRKFESGVAGPPPEAAASSSSSIGLSYISAALREWEVRRSD
ncbi:Protein indeterminate-domain 14 [Striga hermonthica]|uniref:Protein indeterminate-domain 14 n=1 Tax=Striga hermonthica TaxID=68872 RepID=A0A9N7MN07_STRHE|nr:Protein indeterminate-domain 14 [Striga hermonthica]